MYIKTATTRLGFFIVLLFFVAAAGAFAQSTENTVFQDFDADGDVDVFLEYLLVNQNNATLNGTNSTVNMLNTTLSVTKTISNSTLILDLYNTSRNLFTYNITVSNVGANNATNVTIVDTYPNYAIFVNASPSPSSGNNTWNISTLAAGANYSIIITMNLSNSTPNATVLTNTVNVTYNLTQEGPLDGIGQLSNVVRAFAADFNADGYGDWYVLRRNAVNALYFYNNSLGRFQDMSSTAWTSSGVLGSASSAEGTAIADFDLDGDFDVYAAGEMWYNNGTGFENVSNESMLEFGDDIDVRFSQIALDYSPSNAPNIYAVATDGTVRYFENMGDRNADNINEFYDRTSVANLRSISGASFLGVANIEIGSIMPTTSPFTYDEGYDMYVARSSGRDYLFLFESRTQSVLHIYEDYTDDFGFNITGNSTGVILKDFDGNLTDIYVAANGQDRLFLRNGSTTEAIFVEDTVLAQNLTNVSNTTQYIDAWDFLGGDGILDIAGINDVFAVGVTQSVSAAIFEISNLAEDAWQYVVDSVGTVSANDIFQPGDQSILFSANGPVTDSVGGTVDLQVPGNLSLSSSYAVNEDAGTVTITVDRTGGSDGTVTVDYATSDGTATQPDDYTAASGTLTFAAGVVNQTFNISIIDDNDDEGGENFTVNLSNPTGGATLGDASATIAITDDDNAGNLTFTSATNSIGEGGGSATISVTRSGGSDGAASVNYATSDGTATAGSDYTAASGTLNWANGETGLKTFTVSITDDTDPEGAETISLTLSSVVGAVLDSPSTATLTIADNDDAQVEVSSSGGSTGSLANPNYVAVRRCSGKTFQVVASNIGNWDVQKINENLYVETGCIVAPSVPPMFKLRGDVVCVEGGFAPPIFGPGGNPLQLISIDDVPTAVVSPGAEFASYKDKNKLGAVELDSSSFGAGAIGGFLTGLIRFFEQGERCYLLDSVGSITVEEQYADIAVLPPKKGQADFDGVPDDIDPDDIPINRTAINKTGIGDDGNKSTTDVNETGTGNYPDADDDVAWSNATGNLTNESNNDVDGDENYDSDDGDLARPNFDSAISAGIRYQVWGQGMELTPFTGYAILESQKSSFMLVDINGERVRLVDGKALDDITLKSGMTKITILETNLGTVRGIPFELGGIYLGRTNARGEIYAVLDVVGEQGARTSTNAITGNAVRARAAANTAAADYPFVVVQPQDCEECAERYVLKEMNGASYQCTPKKSGSCAVNLECVDTKNPSAQAVLDGPYLHRAVFGGSDAVLSSPACVAAARQKDYKCHADYDCPQSMVCGDKLVCVDAPKQAAANFDAAMVSGSLQSPELQGASNKNSAAAMNFVWFGLVVLVLAGASYYLYLRSKKEKDPLARAKDLLQHSSKLSLLSSSHHRKYLFVFVLFGASLLFAFFANVSSPEYQAPSYVDVPSSPVTTTLWTVFAVLFVSSLLVAGYIYRQNKKVDEDEKFLQDILKKYNIK